MLRCFFLSYSDDKLTKKYIFCEIEGKKRLLYSNACDLHKGGPVTVSSEQKIQWSITQVLK